MRLQPITKKEIPDIVKFPLSEREFHYAFPTSPYPLMETELSAIIQKRSDASVIIDRDTTIAFADLYSINKEECSIGNVIVHPDYRRKGVAAFLLTEMINMAISHHSIARVNVACWCENIAGILLYHKLGFVPFAIKTTRLHDRDNPVILLSKAMS